LINVIPKKHKKVKFPQNKNKKIVNKKLALQNLMSKIAIDHQEIKNNMMILKNINKKQIIRKQDIQ